MTLRADTVRLAGGTAAAQAVGLLALPALSRLYGPEAFAALAFFAGTLQLGGLLMCGRYESAIPLPEDDEEARGLLSLAVQLGLIVTALAAVAAVTMRQAPISLPPVLAESVPWIPVALALTAVYQPYSFWFTRTGRFTGIAWSRIAQTAAAVTTQIGMGLAGRTGSAGLLIGAIAGQALASIVLLRRNAPRLTALPPHASLRRVARTYVDFPRHMTGSGVLRVATDQLPFLLLPFFFGTTIAGWFALPGRVLHAGVALLAGSSAQVFHPHAARVHRDGSLAADTADTIAELARWSFIPIAVATLAAPDFLAVLLGEEWRAAGPFLRALAPWAIGAILAAPLVPILSVTGGTRFSLILHVALLAGASAAFAAAARTGQGAIAVFAYSSSPASSG